MGRRDRRLPEQLDDGGAGGAPVKLEMKGSKSAGGTPVKMLIAQEIARDSKPKQKGPGIIAKLMGLEDDLPPPRSSNACGQRRPVNADLRSTSSAPSSPSRMGEYKDVYGVGYRSPEFSDHKRLDLVHQKVAEAKHHASNDNLLQSREFRDAVEVLNSNRALFLKFFEEPNSVVLKQATELRSSPPRPHTNRITVLKPSKAVESGEKDKLKRQRAIDRNSSCVKNWPQSRYPGERQTDASSKTTQIVILKPVEQFSATGYYASSQDSTFQNKDVARSQAEHCRHHHELSLGNVLSSAFSADESSFNRIDNEEECSLCSNSEAESSSSPYSSDYICRYGSPYISSHFSIASCSPDSMLTKEAKKHFSQRWALGEPTDARRERKLVQRSLSTLGQMLALPDLRREEISDMAYTCKNRRTSIADGRRRAQPIVGDPETTLNLPRSKSVPASSSVYENIHMESPCSESRANVADFQMQITESTFPKQVEKPLKPLKGAKSFFKGRLSGLFMRRKKSKKDQPCPDEKGTKLGEDVLSFGTSEHASALSRIDGKNSPNSCPSSITSQDICSSSAKDVASLEDVQSYELTQSRNSDQPSPLSVLDAPFEGFLEDESEDLSKSSETVGLSSHRDALSRSSPIESVARTSVLDDSIPCTTPDPVNALPTTDKDSELELYLFMELLLSASGLNTATMFFRWHSPHQPLDTVFLDKFIDSKPEEAKSRESRCTKRLLFDYVNSTLVEIGQNALRNAYPCHHSSSTITKAGFPGEPVVNELWRLVRNRFFPDSKPPSSENISIGLEVDRAMAWDAQGMHWEESFRVELDEYCKEICGDVLNELVGEILSDIVVKCPK